MKNLSRYLLLLCAICAATSVFAQPANNECAGATPLTDVSNWCSGTGAYSTVNATLSSQALPTCFPNTGNGPDVWFSFVAEANTLNITVIGATSGNIPPGGTLQEPQLAVYAGTCNNLAAIECISDGFGFNVVESFAGPLTIGQTYYIRVGARNGNTGTFKLCVNNYNAIPELSGDCPTGVILCDKSPFTVESTVGQGSLGDEIDPNSCIQIESASSWYRWTCKEPGTLEFVITPNNPADDLDFALFELPDGLDDCENKLIIRCEAAGETVGAPFADWEICTGATGLSAAETDTDEAPGCSNGQNNFVSAVNMIAGRSYALVINNYSNSGNGFSIEFGGTGTFLGPTADFSYLPDTVCLGQTITFTDASESVDGINAWQWNFGVGANPGNKNGQGPHQISYDSDGLKSVALTITSEAGCNITHVEAITVLPQPDVTPALVADYCGPDDATGSITLTPTGGALPYLYNWQGSGTFSANNSLENLQTGSYTVVVQDANGCTDQFTFEVPEGLSLAVNIDPVTPPTCNGDSDGSISVSIEIANDPVQFDFGNGPQSNNTLSNIPAGTYTVTAIDAAGCSGTFVIEVPDFPPLLLGIDPLDISCFGAMDGTITANPSGGAGGYAFAWSNAESTATISNLAAGNYIVTVTDENGCTTTADADIIEPAELIFTLSTTDVICHGDASGVILISATGGTPPFEFSADGVSFQPDPNLDGLLAGEYQATVRDSRGCTFVLPAVITEPPALTVDAGQDQTVDLGYTADLNAVTTPPFRPVTLTWTPSETLSCPDCFDPTALPLGTTTYYATIVDETNCTATDSVTVFVILNRPIYAPNVFSPNGDGLNDYFILYGGRAAKSILTMRVFDRWGGLVFEGKDLALNEEPQGWDGIFKGKPMNPAVFAYYAEVEFIDGVKVLFKGDVTLLR